MTFSYCTLEDLEKIEVGQELKINGRYEDLKREDGRDFDYVARKDDVVVVQRKTDSHMIVLFFEDTVKLRTTNRERYGEFMIEPRHVQKISFKKGE